jgi:hypothetical protein
MKHGNLTIIYAKETRLFRTMRSIREMCEARTPRQFRYSRARLGTRLQHARRASGPASRDRSRMPTHLSVTTLLDCSDYAMRSALAIYVEMKALGCR